jgi:hypothetical protein
MDRSIVGDVQVPVLKYKKLYQKLLKENSKLKKALKSLRQTRHFECDDSWYNCPKSEYGCANESETECNCGADRINKVIDDALDIGSCPHDVPYCYNCPICDKEQ